MTDKIPIGISSCLLGNEVRYNASHSRDSYINGTLSEFFEFLPFCPEVGIGLGVPRPTIRLVNEGEGIRVVGVKDPAMDVTEPLKAYTQEQLPSVQELSGFIFKRGSPSCGMERVKIYNSKGMPGDTGSGMFAHGVMKAFPHLPTEEEGRLGDPRLRENFLQRVFVYHHWRHQIEPNLSVRELTKFHACIKLTLMSHDQNRARDLGRLAATARDNNLQEIAAEYLEELMAILKIVASRKNHVNVLQHIQGYLKRNLDSDDKAELVDTIMQYGRGEVPLIVPVTLLRHHFRKCPDDYIDNAWYMSPYPMSLKLRNRL
jgi:uncharacterized protein YbgA (DUF1722 family)/uncharacterized protein YbbK (DUF523 family)